MTFTGILESIVDRLDKGADPSDLKAYIATAHDQAEAVGKAVLDLEEELSQYKELYEKAAAEVERLKPAHLKDELQPGHIEVLKAMATTEEARSRYAAEKTGMSDRVAEMFLRELGVRKFVQAQFIHSGNDRYYLYSITPAGTRYLYDRGEVK